MRCCVTHHQLRTGRGEALSDHRPRSEGGRRSGSGGQRDRQRTCLATRPDPTPTAARRHNKVMLSPLARSCPARVAPPVLPAAVARPEGRNQPRSGFFSTLRRRLSAKLAGYGFLVRSNAFGGYQQCQCGGCRRGKHALSNDGTRTQQRRNLIR